MVPVLVTHACQSSYINNEKKTNYNKETKKMKMAGTENTVFEFKGVNV
jgi:hypothetical protein